MVVLSLFDGASCEQIALHELGVKIDKYYASEVDKFAIQNTMLNFPDTVQLGDVRNVDVERLGKVDLLIGGSPCTNLSFCGKRAGMSTKENELVTTLDRYLELKEQGFEFEGQSYLFWEYVRILHELRRKNPDLLFLLENVEMGKKWEAVFDEALGLRGLHINSALVSAQVRKRIYWTNIRAEKSDLFGMMASNMPQPQDRHILLRDILEENVSEKYFLSEEYIKKLLAYNKRQDERGNGFKATPRLPDEKMTCVTVGGKAIHDLVCVAQRDRTYKGEPQHLEIAPNSDKTNCLTTVAKDNMIMQLNPSRESGDTLSHQQNRIYSTKGKSPALCHEHAGFTFNVWDDGLRVRRLTPTECARLQTIPPWYKWGVS